jgi:hypothetical protein
MQASAIKILGPAPHTGTHLADTFKNQTLYEMNIIERQRIGETNESRIQLKEIPTFVLIIL